MPFAIGVSLEEDSPQGIFQGISGNSEWFSKLGSWRTGFDRNSHFKLLKNACALAVQSQW